jgi:hypothetical protein
VPDINLLSCCPHPSPHLSQRQARGGRVRHHVPTHWLLRVGHKHGAATGVGHHLLRSEVVNGVSSLVRYWQGEERRGAERWWRSYKFLLPIAVFRCGSPKLLVWPRLAGAFPWVLPLTL